MEHEHDLRKFITEWGAAQACAVLSSGREAPCDALAVRLTAGRQPAAAIRRRARDQRPDREIDSVGRLTPGVGWASSMPSGSVLTAVEALQEAENEFGAGVMIDGCGFAAVRTDGQSARTAYPSTDLGLTA
jgi:hypothetical protein